jgi:hypothetical protein
MMYVLMYKGVIMIKIFDIMVEKRRRFAILFLIFSLSL